MPMLEIDTTYADFPTSATWHTLWTGSVTTRDIRIQIARLTCCSFPDVLFEIQYNNGTLLPIQMVTNQYHYAEQNSCYIVASSYETINRIRMAMGVNSTFAYCESSERIRFKICMEMFNHPSTDGSCAVNVGDDRFSRVDLTLSYS